jgi:Tfp pilus assembly protein PilZ
MLHSEARNPRFVNILSYILLSFPVSYILVLGTFHNLTAAKMAAIVFSFYYIAHSVFAVITGLALKKMKPFAWHFYVFHSFVMIVAQFVITYRYSEAHIREIPLSLICITIFGLLAFLKLELRVPYFSPKIAWWESDPRYKISVPVQMTSADHFYKGDIMDISSSGCFIKTKDPLKVDQSILIKFSLFDHKFECNGKVVWRTESGVTHPKGVGIKFNSLSKQCQADLKDTVKKLKSLSRKFKDIRAEEKTDSIERKVKALAAQKKA